MVNFVMMWKLKAKTLCVVLFLGISTLNPSLAADVGDKLNKPNILIILADDMGYSDLGIMGSEINTPNLDSLASQGTLFTNTNVHVFCTPTRAMLLTGVNNVAAGIGTMAGEWRGGQKDAPGYETYLSNRVVTVASLLQDDGYETFISGKWDLGGRQSDAHLPTKRGFDKSWILVEGSSDHFAAIPAIAELPDVNYRENGKPVDLPQDFFSSKTFTDKMIGFIEQNKTSDKPFFGYLSFTAPHYPLQAPQEYIKKYRGAYDQGYKAIRTQRIENMKRRGIIAEDFEASDPHPRWPSWDELSSKHRAFEIARMEVYAAMIDNMDHHIGRVVQHLRDIGEYDNTLIIFLSDNGAEGGNPLDWADYYVDWAESTFDLSIENTGSRTNYSWTGPQWAHVSSAPFNLFKAFPTAGGVRVPMIVSHPTLVKSGKISSDAISVMDVPATLLEISGISHPGQEYKGRPVKPIEGQSFAGALSGKQAADTADRAMVWEMLARRAVQKGDWKIIWLEAPWDENEGWALYNIKDDPAEAQDLSKQHPEVLADLLMDWEAFVAENGVIALDKIKLTYTNEDSHFKWLPKAEREDSK